MVIQYHLPIGNYQYSCFPFYLVVLVPWWVWMNGCTICLHLDKLLHVIIRYHDTKLIDTAHLIGKSKSNGKSWEPFCPAGSSNRFCHRQSLPPSPSAAHLLSSICACSGSFSCKTSLPSVFPPSGHLYSSIQVPLLPSHSRCVKAVSWMEGCFGLSQTQRPF